MNALDQTALLDSLDEAANEPDIHRLTPSEQAWAGLSACLIDIVRSQAVQL